MASVTRNASAEPAAVWVDVPESIDVVPGQPQSITLTVGNAGDADLASAQLRSELAGEALTPVAVPAIAAGESAEVTLTVVVEREGAQTLTLTLDDGRHLDVARVRLEADAGDEPVIVAGATPTPSPGAGPCGPGLGLVLALVVGGRIRRRSPR